MVKIGIGILIAAAVTALGLLFFNLQQSLLMGVVAFLVTLWTNQALPLGAVSLLPIVLFPLFGVLEVNDVTSNYSNSIIFLFLGGFLLAIAMEKTQLHKIISHKLLATFPSTPLGVIYALATISALLSAVLSNTTTTLMLITIGLYLTENVELKKRFLLAIAYGASIGGIITPIGTPPNLILLGFLEDRAMSAPTFGAWVALMSPVVAVMLATVPYLLSLGVKDQAIGFESKAQPMNKEQKRLSYLLLVLVGLFILNTPIRPYYEGIGLNEKALLLAFGLFTFMPRYGFLQWEDTRKIPYQIIFLFGAGFSIAMGFSQTGLAASIAENLHFLQSMPFLVMLFFIALFVSFTTEVTSNTALISIALPIFYSFAANDPENGLLIMLTATVAASYAFMLPIATPPNAIAMSSGAISIGDMARVGVKINFIGVFVVSLVAYFIWSLFL